jgi:hypothetical protein
MPIVRLFFRLDKCLCYNYFASKNKCLRYNYFAVWLGNLVSGKNETEKIGVEIIYGIRAREGTHPLIFFILV